jgi:hypothetical protein
LNDTSSGPSDSNTLLADSQPSMTRQRYMLNFQTRSVHDQVSRTGWASDRRSLADWSLARLRQILRRSCAPQRLRSFLFAPLVKTDALAARRLRQHSAAVPASEWIGG